MLDQNFVLRVSEIRSNKPKLVALLNEIETDKREIKKKLQKFSSNPKTETGIDTKKRSKLINSLKNKQAYLKDEANHVRSLINTFNQNKAALNRATTKKAGLPEAFMAAAELLLDEEQFVELELKAVQILEGNTA